jgi:hypothetical protein
MKQKLNIAFTLVYVGILLLGLNTVEDHMILIYISYIIVSAAIQFAILQRLILDPIMQQNPLVNLSSYLFITTALTLTYAQPDDNYMLEMGYIYVVLFTAIYFNKRVSYAIAFLSIVSFGIIYKTVPVEEMQYLLCVVGMTVLLFAISAVVHLPRIRARLQ